MLALDDRRQVIGPSAADHGVCVDEDDREGSHERQREAGDLVRSLARDVHAYEGEEREHPQEDCSDLNGRDIGCLHWTAFQVVYLDKPGILMKSTEDAFTMRRFLATAPPLD